MYPYSTSYEALALRSFNLDTITRTLRVAMKTHGDVEYAPTTGTSTVPVKILVNKHSEVPTFAHPHVIDGEVIFDARTLTKVGPTGEFKVTNNDEFKFRHIRALLEQHWALEPDWRQQLTTISQLPLETYIKWFSENITRRLGLGPETQVKLAAVAGFFYIGIAEGPVMNERVWLRMLAMVSKASRIPANRLNELFPEPVQFNSISELTMYIAEHLDDPRLSKMDSALLYNILSGAWFSQNGNEVMGVAIEHPPTWIACIYHALGNRAYRNSSIGRILDRSVKGSSGNDFQRAILSLVS